MTPICNILDHNWGHRGSMEVHALVRSPDGDGFVSTRVPRLLYFAAIARLTIRVEGAKYRSLDFVVRDYAALWA